MNARLRLSPTRVVFDGDSMVNTPTDPTTSHARMHPDNFPYKVMAGRKTAAANVATSGLSWLNLETTAPTRVDVQFGRAPLTGLIMVGGHGDITNAANAAAVYTRWVNYAVNRTAAGFAWIIAATTTGSFANDAPAEQRRIDSNALLLADASDAFDAVVDLAAVTGLDDINSAYYADFLHWSAEGTDLVADTISPVLATFLA